MPTEQSSNEQPLTLRQQQVQTDLGDHPRDLIIQYADEGLLHSQVAQKLGISERSLKVWRKRWRIKWKRRAQAYVDSE